MPKHSQGCEHGLEGDSLSNIIADIKHAIGILDETDDELMVCKEDDELEDEVIEEDGEPCDMDMVIALAYSLLAEREEDIRRCIEEAEAASGIELTASGRLRAMAAMIETLETLGCGLEDD